MVNNEWCRDDLPSRADVHWERTDEALKWRVSRDPDMVLDAVVEHLNEHHPKADRVTLSMVAKARRWKHERDAAVARAEAAEARLAALEARPWALVMDDKSSPVFCPAITRDEVEKSVKSGMSGFVAAIGYQSATEATDTLWNLLKGDDPAVFVVRESDLPEVQRREDGFWATSTDDDYYRPTPESLRRDIASYLRFVASREAVARAIEAEQDMDPVEELAEQIETATRDALRTVVDSLTTVAPGLTPPDVEGLLDQTIRDQSHTLAARVLGQEASDE